MPPATAAVRPRLAPLSAVTSRSTTAVLAALVLVGALLRFVTLGQQSFWYDEAVTAALMRDSFGHMLSTVPHLESNPPLFYVVSWIWGKIFGTSEVGLRSLSAVLGTATIPVAYAASAALLRRRTLALAVAAFTAVSPIVVWYSQEARSYALYTFLAALSVMFFARALDMPSALNLWGWSAASTLAIVSHYFAAFVVVGEVVILFSRLGFRRIAAPTALVTAAVIAVAPLAQYQNSHVAAGASIRAASIGWRIEETGLRFTFLYYNPGGRVALALVVAAAALLAWRGRNVGRARAALVIAVASLGIPILLALVHTYDVYFFRNVLGAWLPLMIAVAAGLPSSRLGGTLAGLIGAGLLVCTLAIPLRVPLQRDSWRDAVSAVQQLSGSRLIVGDGRDMQYTFAYYWSTPRPLSRAGADVREIDLVGRYVNGGSRISGLERFRPVALDQAGNMAILRLRATRPLRVTPGELAGYSLSGRLVTG